MVYQNLVENKVQVHAAYKIVGLNRMGAVVEGGRGLGGVQNTDFGRPWGNHFRKGNNNVKHLSRPISWGRWIYRQKIVVSEKQIVLPS